MKQIMSRTILEVCLALAIISIASSQDTHPLFSISPAEVKVGRSITVRYDPTAPSAQLKNVTEVYVDAVIYRQHIYEDDNQPARADARLKKDGDQWVGTLSIDDPEAKYILFRVISGEQKDDNGGKCWDALVFGDDGKPIRGAYLLRGGYYAGWGYYYITRPKEVKDSIKAKADLQHELEIYPDDFQAEIDLWDLAYDVRGIDDAAKAASKSELDRLYEKYKGSEMAVYRLFRGYNRIGDRKSVV